AWRPRLPPEHRVVRKGAEQVLEVLRSERIVTAGHGARGLRPDSAGVADDGGEGGGDAADPGVASHSSSTSVGDETKSGRRPDRLPLALPAVRIEQRGDPVFDLLQVRPGDAVGGAWDRTPHVRAQVRQLRAEQ